MFLFKKVVAQFFFPVPLILLIFLVGLFFLWFTEKQKVGKILISAGIFILALLSYEPIPNALLSPLEYRYDSYGYGKTNELSPPQYPHPVKFVVVLGGGHSSDPSMPITSQIGTSSLVRLVEGIRIHRQNPGSKLILSGGSAFDPVPVAKVMADTVKAIGLYGNHVIIESRSKDTKDQALLLKSVVLEDWFVLVTSASHMPRSVALFEKLGMRPIPAPTEYLVVEKHGSSPDRYFPDIDSLEKAERAFYEYLGIVWAKMRGQI